MSTKREVVLHYRNHTDPDNCRSQYQHNFINVSSLETVPMAPQQLQNDQNPYIHHHSQNHGNNISIRFTDPSPHIKLQNPILYHHQIILLTTFQSILWSVLRSRRYYFSQMASMCSTQLYTLFKCTLLVLTVYNTEKLRKALQKKQHSACFG